MKQLTLIMPYYMNPSMLARHYALWASYPDDVKARLEVLIVDDGSPEGHAIDVPRPDGLPRLSILRVDVDIPWNQHGARNLGAHVAQDGWLLMTDMDHMVPVETLRAVFTVTKERVYTFGRVDAPRMKPTLDREGKPKAHVNSFALTRAMYWKAGGYDEDFCGMYGTDGLFRARLYSLYKQQVLPEPLIRVPREVVSDASTVTLVRRGEGATTKQTTKERREWKKQSGREHLIAVLSFPWHVAWTSDPSRLCVGSGAARATA